MPVALVTGASRGLGKQITYSLAENGYSVIVNHLALEKEASAIVNDIGNDSVAIKADVRYTKQVNGIARQIEDKFGRLDVIINNAGTAKDNLLLKQTEQEWDETISTNLKGCFNIIGILAPVMIKSGGGHIINISSYSGIRGKAGQPAYSASKAALFGLTYSAARELAEYNIRVNAVIPGYMMTEMGIKAFKAMEIAKENSIMKKLSDPEEIAGFIVYLLSTKNITGQVFSLDSRII